MNLESGIARAPHPFRNEFAAVVPEQTATAYPVFAELVNNAASCCPYLRGLIGKDLEWILSLPGRDPRAAFKEILAANGYASPTATARQLRLTKRRAAFLIALADLGGVWTLHEILRALTQVADHAVQRLLDSLVNQAVKDGKLPALADGEDPADSGLVALAMGKMGARELNYSSDIDLVMLFDETRYDQEEFARVRKAFVAITRQFSLALSRTTSEGYIFRCDLRLRPDPLVTQVCMSIDAAERYYESFGRTWERAAYIKARPCAGDIEAGSRFIGALKPFIWRRNLDYAAIQDARDMQSLIKESRGLRRPIEFPGHDIKLGRGGIREIEFLAQTIQIIAGGRDPDIRPPATLDALAALRSKKWIDQDLEHSLVESYCYLRSLENRLQMVRDAQTHVLPKHSEEIERLACLCSASDVNALQQAATRVLRNVHASTERFYAKKIRSIDSGEAFELTKSEEEFCDRWRNLPVLRNDRARTIFSRILPEILAQLRKAAKPREALAQFDGFIRRLPAGVQLFSMFEANPKLIALLTDICATAPDLAEYLSQNAQVFEAVIYGKFFAPVPDAASLAAELAQVLERCGSLEQKIAESRMWAKEQHFRVGVQHLRGLASWQEATASYANLAQATLAATLPVAIEEVERRTRVVAQSSPALLALDSLGAGTLTPKSALSFILLYDTQPLAGIRSEGKASIQDFHTRLVRTLKVVLTSRIKQGQLYEISSRIRPSGKSGLVATSVADFQDYQIERAETWEHLALTRARVVAGPAKLAKRIEQIREELISLETPDSKLIAEMRSLRRRFVEKPAQENRSGDWELRLGRGRLLDIEGFSQAGALLAGSPSRSVGGQLAASVSTGWITRAQANTLHSCHELLRAMLQVARLTAKGQFNPTDIGTGATDLLLRETGASDLEDLQKRLWKSSDESGAVISDALSRQSID